MRGRQDAVEREMRGQLLKAEARENQGLLVFVEETTTYGGTNKRDSGKISLAIGVRAFVRAKFKFELRF